ncbi:DUF6807 family protein [Micromonospora sp. NPDC049559]|uniref:DUF6807 family protein n=1 Tax=Micromonospora sp. NPDC049559 TaxID=3155923 RepID=UPI00341ABF36
MSGREMNPVLRVEHLLGRSVVVSAGAVPLLTYTYRPDTSQLDSPKPYLHPVRTPGRRPWRRRDGRAGGPGPVGAGPVGPAALRRWGGGVSAA